MSRRRKVDELRYTDSLGREHVSRSVVKEPPALAGIIPRRSRLVDAHDDAGHLVAVLVRNAGLPPVVVVPGDVGPRFVLERGGLAAAMVWADERTGQPMIGTLGTPRASFPVYCRECRHESMLSAAALAEAAERARPGRPSRIVLAGVS